ncbi:type II secretion system protein GspK [Paracidovorax sp. MALMAid1276]|uniref:type II secretion system protein GspK n=1 Tax=Paracidovorax sp. MALMAid1276 TaxID=3411631 RepID=UPI003B9BBF73
MALIAVLWIVAALSLTATGLMQSAKQEIRASSRARQMVAAAALADGAIRVVLQDLAASRSAVGRAVRLNVPLMGQSVDVEVSGLKGLVDINHAPSGLLAALFEHAGAVPAPDATRLAQVLMEWRKRPGADGRPMGLDAPEDLLQVPGFDYPLYARIRPLISASLPGSGLVNPEAADLAVLTVLAQGNAALAAQLAAARETSSLPMDTTQLTAAFKDASTGNALSVTASVPVGDSLVLRRTWWVTLSASGRNGLPWRVLEQRQAIEPGARP